MTAILRDVTERNRDAARLAEAHNRFAGAFSAAATGMALVAPDGRMLEVNEALCRLLGRSAETIGSMTFQQLTHPDDLDADLAELQRTLAGEIDSYQLTKRYLLPDGGIVWGLLTVSAVREAEWTPALLRLADPRRHGPQDRRGRAAPVRRTTPGALGAGPRHGARQPADVRARGGRGARPLRRRRRAAQPAGRARRGRHAGARHVGPRPRQPRRRPRRPPRRRPARGAAARRRRRCRRRGRPAPRRRPPGRRARTDRQRARRRRHPQPDAARRLQRGHDVGDAAGQHRDPGWHRPSARGRAAAARDAGLVPDADRRRRLRARPPQRGP